MNKPTIKSNIKVKVKKKGLVLPVCATVFFFVVIITITMNNDLVSLMGNSVINNYMCPDNYELKGNTCKLVVDAYKLGDVNKDNTVDKKDLDTMNKYIETNYSFSTDELLLTDVNLDGKFNTSDVNKLKFYLSGMNIDNINDYICKTNYELENNKCIKYEKAIALDSNLDIGSAITYNDSIWYIIDNKDDYLVLLKTDYIEDAVDYSSIDNILNNYISNISNDLKEINGSKIRLMNIDDIKKLGFVDKTNTNYYESTLKTPYYIGITNTNYWLNDNYILTNYEDNNYAYKTDNSSYAYIRPVINVYKDKLK